jgi:hypothetical protein
VVVPHLLCTMLSGARQQPRLQGARGSEQVRGAVQSVHLGIGSSCRSPGVQLDGKHSGSWLKI